MKFRKIAVSALSALMAFSVLTATAASAATDNTQSVGSYYNSSELYSTYSGSDLGASYSKASTSFKVWAPSASNVVLNLYTRGSDKEQGSSKISSTTMTKNSSNGTWSTTINGDQNGIYYTYSVTVNGKTEETQDVYSTATGVNGNRSMVVDLNSTDPDGWENDTHKLVDNPTDAVIWEVQVRDFSIDSSSGVSEKNRGKYLAFTETGTKINSTDSLSTCVDYLVEQGVNYVHLNPVYDYGSVDETKLDTPQYNWGYDPVNYNVPDGSFSSDPYNGEVRIKEFKQMVQALHDRGIGVVMDVVYNHVYSAKDSCFEKTVPGYYFRMKNETTFLNGSDCGNVTASDKTMYRKYMIDSVKYWAKEYHIDGFRFDLMGCHDITTMNQIRAALDSDVDSRILMYGEPWPAFSGWTGENGIAQSDWCIMDNASKVNSRIGMFSDKMRNSLKGDTNDASKGYIQGLTTLNNDIKAGMMGGASSTFGKWSQQPSQCVTYNSAHDNLTLWDKILYSNGSSDYNGTNSTLLAQNKLSAAIILTSQGMPFYMAGEEFARTKYGDHNSYKSSDSVNKIDWNRVKTYNNLVNYYKGLQKIRAAYSPFRDPSTTSGGSTYFVENGSAIGYTIQNKLSNASKEWGTVAVLVNNGSSSKTLTLKSSGTLPSSWVVVANGNTAGLTKIETISGSNISVPARTAMVLVDASTFDRYQEPVKEYKTITTKHVDNSSGTVLKETSSQVLVGATYRTQADSDLLFDYNLIRVDGVESGTVTNNVTVTYYYEKDTVSSYTLTVKYVDQSGNALAAEKSQKYKDGQTYETTYQTVSGYELDTTKLPAKIVGTITEDTTVTYTYKQTTAAKLKVHYYNSKGWSTPHMYSYDDSGASTVMLTGAWPGKAMTSEGSNWWTYPEVDVKEAKVMFTNGATTGTAQEPVANMPGYEATGEVWIQDATVKFGGKVIVSYINQNGETLADDTVVVGEKITSSDSYTTQGITGHGEPVAVLGGATGKWSVGVKNVVYVYESEVVEPISYMVGDADQDGRVSLSDVIEIQRHMVLLLTLTGDAALAADVNGDGRISSMDAILIQQYAVGITTKYKIGEIVTVTQ